LEDLMLGALIVFAMVVVAPVCAGLLVMLFCPLDPDAPWGP
jgi:hypothetical protein